MTGETSRTAESIAAAFTTARRSAAPLAAFPGALPESMAAAYAIQDAAIAVWPDRIAGWKVAGVAPAFRDRVAETRLAGPAFARRIYTPSNEPARAAVFVGGFAAVEAEFILRMDADIPADVAADPQRLAAAVGAVHAGAEIASSPLAVLNDLGPTAVAADFGNNNGLILGPEIAGWRGRAWTELTSRTSVNGAVVGEGDASRVAGSPLAALAFLAAHLAARGRPLRRGDLVSTGMTTGIHMVAVGDRVRFDFCDGIAFEADIVAATAA
jgi:2-keto-4-pentenoate hydratase